MNERLWKDWATTEKKLWRHRLQPIIFLSVSVYILVWPMKTLVWSSLMYPWLNFAYFDVNILSWENSWVRIVWVASSVLILALKILSVSVVLYCPHPQKLSKTIKNLSKTRQKRRSHSELFARIQNGYLWHCINFYPNNCLLLVIYYLAILFYILRTMEKNAKLQTKTSNSSRHQNWRSHLSC